ncbi:hypothetical protein BGZ65_003788, partial [Modicella reniformis]
MARLAPASLKRSGTAQRTLGFQRQKKQAIPQVGMEASAKFKDMIHRDEYCNESISMTVLSVDGQKNCERELKSSGEHHNILDQHVRGDHHQAMIDGSDKNELTTLLLDNSSSSPSLLHKEELAPTSTTISFSAAVSSPERMDSFRFPTITHPHEKNALERPRRPQHSYHHSLPYNTIEDSRHLSTTLDVRSLSPSDTSRRVYGLGARIPGSSSDPDNGSKQNWAGKQHEEPFMPTLIELAANSCTTTISSQRETVSTLAMQERRPRLRRSGSCSNIGHRPSLSLSSSKKDLLSLQERRMKKPDAKAHRLADIQITTIPMQMYSVEMIDLPERSDSTSSDPVKLAPLRRSPVMDFYRSDEPQERVFDLSSTPSSSSSSQQHNQVMAPLGRCTINSGAEATLSSTLEAIAITPDPVDDMGETKRFVKRSHALRELEATEESYVNDLDTLMHNHDNYLYGIYCELRMRTIKEINRSAGTTAMALLQKESKELMAQQGRPSSRADVKDFLIKPIQRICRYPLLLNEILRLTGEDDAEYQYVDQAYQSVKKKAQEMDETQKLVEGKLLTEQFLKKLPETSFPRKTGSTSCKEIPATMGSSHEYQSHGHSAHHNSSTMFGHQQEGISSPGFVPDNYYGFTSQDGIVSAPLTKAFAGTLGSIVLAGALEYVNTNEMSPRLKYYGCFLFDSMLIVVKAKKPSLYEPRQWLPLRLCELQETVRLDGYTRYGWRIGFDQFRIEFGAGCEAEQQKWTSTLQDRIQAAKNAYAKLPRDIAVFETIVSSLPWKVNKSQALGF